MFENIKTKYEQFQNFITNNLEYDKLLHSYICLIVTFLLISIIGYTLGIFLSIWIGIWKEIFDVCRSDFNWKNFDKKDLMADLSGVVLAIILHLIA